MTEYQVTKRLVRNKETGRGGTTWGYVVMNTALTPSDPKAIERIPREKFAKRPDKFFVIGKKNKRKNYVTYSDDDELGLIPTTEADKDATNNLTSLPTELVDQNGRSRS